MHWQKEGAVMFRRATVLGAFALLLGLPRAGHAQTTATYHLHKEVSATNSAFDQLKTAVPEAASTTIASVDLKNTVLTEDVIKSFVTQSGVHGLGGIVPENSTEY